MKKASTIKTVEWGAARLTKQPFAWHFLGLLKQHPQSVHSQDPVANQLVLLKFQMTRN